MKNRVLFLKIAVIFLVPLLALCGFSFSALANEVAILGNASEVPEPVRDVLNLNCKSAILMEANTGRVLYEQNADVALPPASVTKVMT